MPPENDQAVMLALPFEEWIHPPDSWLQCDSVACSGSSWVWCSRIKDNGYCTKCGRRWSFVYVSSGGYKFSVPEINQRSKGKEDKQGGAGNGEAGDDEAHTHGGASSST